MECAFEVDCGLRWGEPTSSNHIRVYINNLIVNIKKCTNIKIDIFTHNPLTLRYVSIFLDHPHGTLHQTPIYERQIDKNLVIKTVDIIKFILIYTIGPCNVNIIALQNYKFSY